MINDKGIIEINDPTIAFISDWKDNYGIPIIDRYVQSGRVLIDKQMTGCGFTTYYLKNSENVILLSPRIKLITNKLQKMPGLFYFNRQLDKKKKPLLSLDDLRDQFFEYSNYCSMNRLPMKILCIYDSFNKLTDMLENAYGIDINQVFRIVIDETHSLIKDVKLKQCRNKSVLSDLLRRLFQYNNLLFVSATPLKDYMNKIPEFKANDVDYYEMRWKSARRILRTDHKCKGAKDAFDQIYKFYQDHRDSHGRHYFDAIYSGNGNAEYSYEAVIYLNDVSAITRILNDYVKKNGLIDIKDITILCGENNENSTLLKSVHKSLDYTTRIPQEGEPHRTWTFVTSTCFWGVDFCSNNASSFVIANYHVSSLSLDIASDIPQIVGRQRLDCNKFRDTLHIFFTNKVDAIDDSEYIESQRDKMNESKQQISLWEDARADLKDIALANLNKVIDKDPNALYVSTVSGKPEIDELLIAAEDYSRDIVKNSHHWFINSRNNVNNITFGPIAEQMKSDLYMTCSPKVTTDRIRIVHGYFCNYPNMQGEFYEMLRMEGFNDIAYYFSELDLDRIRANGFDSSKMDNEIVFQRKRKDVSALVSSKFESGKTYSKKEVKELLQGVYDGLGLKKKAKATDLPNFIRCEEIKSNGSRAIHII